MAYIQHTLLPDQTLSQIAEIYSTTYEQIALDNILEPELAYKELTINLPSTENNLDLFHHGYDGLVLLVKVQGNRHISECLSQLYVYLRQSIEEIYQRLLNNDEVELSIKQLLHTSHSGWNYFCDSDIQWSYELSHNPPLFTFNEEIESGGPNYSEGPVGLHLAALMNSRVEQLFSIERMVLGEFSPSMTIFDMTTFDLEYNRLYQAVENANPKMVGLANEELLNYCEMSINRAMAWLASNGSQQAQMELEVSTRSWEQFLRDSQEAVGFMTSSAAGGNAFEQDAGLAKADLLRGRFAQLNRYIAMQMRFAEYQGNVENPEPIETVAERTTQGDWHYCKKCGGLFFTSLYKGKYAKDMDCKNGGNHDFNNTPNRTLTKVDPPGEVDPSPTEEASWRFCVNCHGLFHVVGDAGLSYQGKCVQPDTAHEFDSTHADYILEVKTGSPGDAEEAYAYFECNKCGGLFHNWDNANAVCNADGTQHAKASKFTVPPMGKYYILGSG